MQREERDLGDGNERSYHSIEHVTGAHLPAQVKSSSQDERGSVDDYPLLLLEQTDLGPVRLVDQVDGDDIAFVHDDLITGEGTEDAIWD